MYSQEPRPELGEFAALQWTRTELCRLLRDYFRSCAPEQRLRVGTDLPFYYDPADRLARVTPDLHLVGGMAYEEKLRSYRVWERQGVAPRLVVHLVDTALSPEDGLMMHFLRLGAEDVVLFDPLWHLQPAQAPSGRRPLWHYHRSDGRLGLQRQEHPGRIRLAGYGPRGLWFSHRGGSELRLYVEPDDRPGVFPTEAGCWPTAEERALG